MIAKIKRGNGFRGVLDYALEKEGGLLIGGNMLGQTPRELSSEFRIAREADTEAINPVWHCSISLCPGEHLDDIQWQSVVDRYTQKLGFTENNPYVIVKHNDTEHDHVHIIASRISYTGQLYGGQNDGLKSQKILPAFEKEYGLTIVNREKAQKKTLTRTEREKELRLGKPAPRKYLQEAVESILVKGFSDHLEFSNELEKKGIKTVFNTTKAGDVRGVSFGYEGLTFKGSSLGKKYSWNKIKYHIKEKDNGIYGDQRREISRTFEHRKSEVGQSGKREKNHREECEKERTADDRRSLSPGDHRPHGSDVTKSGRRSEFQQRHAESIRKETEHISRALEERSGDIFKSLQHCLDREHTKLETWSREVNRTIDGVNAKTSRSSGLTQRASELLEGPVESSLGERIHREHECRRNAQKLNSLSRIISTTAKHIRRTIDTVSAYINHERTRGIAESIGRIISPALNNLKLPEVFFPEVEYDVSKIMSEHTQEEIPPPFMRDTSMNLDLKLGKVKSKDHWNKKPEEPKKNILKEYALKNKFANIRLKDTDIEDQHQRQIRPRR